MNLLKYGTVKAEQAVWFKKNAEMHVWTRIAMVMIVTIIEAV